MPIYHGNKNYFDGKEFVVLYSSINNGLSLRLNVDFTSFRNEQKSETRQKKGKKKDVRFMAPVCVTD